MLLILLVFLVLLELVLEKIGTNSTSRRSTKTTEKATSSGVGSPPSRTTSGECSTQTSFAVGAGLARRVLAWSAALLGISGSTVLRVVLVLGRVRR